ncbi:MAG: hypothetical protein DYH14_04785 [Betaproteobacteria bacterium PRO3]|nr:hypothetical protein [Betaproteobacteria bacterium PRO3]
MRSSGCSVTIHSDSGRGRGSRLPVAGSFTHWRRFQTMRPTYASLFRMPVPSDGPAIALAVQPRALRVRAHVEPGEGTPSRLSVFAIQRADRPSA